MTYIITKRTISNLLEYSWYSIEIADNAPLNSNPASSGNYKRVDRKTVFYHKKILFYIHVKYQMLRAKCKLQLSVTLASI